MEGVRQSDRREIVNARDFRDSQKNKYCLGNFQVGLKHFKMGLSPTPPERGYVLGVKQSMM